MIDVNEPNPPPIREKEKIKVLGAGGAGNNAINRMIEENIPDIEYIAANTDSATLDKNLAEKKILLGPNLKKGHGAGTQPEIGAQAAEESRQNIAQVIEGADILFIAAGMGGGTGTGGAPVIAKIAKDLGILTVAFVTMPFRSEGRKKAAIAEKGVDELLKVVDAMVVVHNQKLIEYVDENVTVENAFMIADEILRDGVLGISRIILDTGQINTDFSDIVTTLKGSGIAYMGIGREKGKGKIIDAVKKAISSPLVETTINGAGGLLFVVTGNKNKLTMRAVDEAMAYLEAMCDKDVLLINGTFYTEGDSDEITVTVIATRLPQSSLIIEETLGEIEIEDDVEYIETEKEFKTKISRKPAPTSMRPIPKEEISDYEEDEEENESLKHHPLFSYNENEDSRPSLRIEPRRRQD